VSGRRVLILGGGMAGLATAWELSRPDRGDGQAVRSITVVQRGWRLGGKAASSRGRSGRIEEHGLHVWLGYYDNAFRLMRDCYDELDRATTDPSCPLRTWRDAFSPSGTVGVADRGGDGAWTAEFAGNDLVPGDPATAHGMDPARFVDRSLTLVRDLLGSVTDEPVASSTVLSASPWPPRRSPVPEDLAALARTLELGALAVGSRMAGALAAAGGAVGASADPVVGGLVAQLGRLADDLERRLVIRPDGRRLLVSVDLLLASVRGVLADRLLDPARGFAAVDHLDFREWLARHGAARSTLDSGIVAGMYDLVFAYQDGRADRPRFAAGQGLELAARFFFDYKGSLFWKMQAGMGETVIAPIVQVLRRRGVRFRLFTEVEHLELEPSRPALAAVHLRRQDGIDGRDLDPLVRVGGIPCFGNRPPPGTATANARGFEHHGARRGPVEVLRVGEDVDTVVLATSIGVVPLVAPDLLARDERWRRTVAEVRTVATRAAQLWFTEPEDQLGLASVGSTTSGWGPPFDTYASMSHLLPVERWDAARRPRGLGYLCGVIPEPAGNPDLAHDAVAQDLARYLAGPVADVLPRSHDAAGFRWSTLAAPDGVEGPDRLAHQHLVASVDPSDRYVQSLPATRSARLAAAGSGVDGLVLAGDWTDNGIDAGCIEGAVVSGLQAANAVLGRDACDRVLGGWTPSDRQEAHV
jgi:uncharacterized protein with NAD-binding domain and iron-sulfur cluster